MIHIEKSALRTVPFVAGVLTLIFSVELCAQHGAPAMEAITAGTSKTPVRFWNPRLEENLARLLDAWPAPDAELNSRYRIRDGRVQVEFLSDSPASLVSLLEAEGAKNILAGDDLVEAFASPNTIMRALERPDVQAIRPPRYLIGEPVRGMSTRESPDETKSSSNVDRENAGPYVTEGLQAMNAQAWHSATFRGDGLKIGIIDSFGGVESLFGTELPPASRVFMKDFSGIGFGANYRESHGVACAEIIYDIAPGATLYLAQGNTISAVRAAIDWFASQGVKVVSMSLGALGWGGPGDGSGPIAAKIDAFVSSGGLWFNSAGNSRLRHWQGRWKGASEPSILDFGGGQPFNVLTYSDGSPREVDKGQLVSFSSATLIWNQWSSPQTDLNLALVVCNSSLACSVGLESKSVQSGQSSQSPLEQIEGDFVAPQDGILMLVVSKKSGPTDIDLEIVTNSNYPGKTVFDGSLLNPSDAAGAIAVAALDAASPYSLETYSSRGPTNGPGGSITNGVTKPDISGYANVSTAAYGVREFNGTSAATPHAAGAAALVWSANPSWTNSEVRSFLESRAIELGSNGKDIDYGVGRLYLGSPTGVPLPTAAFIFSPANPAPNQSIQFTDTSTGSPTSWSWSFGDGTTSATRNPTKTYAAAGSYTVTLTVSNASGSNSASKTVVVQPAAPSGDPLSLSTSRVKVWVSYRNQYSGETGVGRPLPQKDEFGFFYFFDASNPEVFVKVLDFGADRPFLLFAAGLTDFEYTVTFQNVRTGKIVSWTKPANAFDGFVDTANLPQGIVKDEQGMTLEELGFTYSRLIAEAREELAAASEELLLSRGRVRVTVNWRNQYSGETGTGKALPKKDEFGFFYFTDPNNPEVFVKALDFGADRAFLLFYAGLTDLEYTVTFTNLCTGATWSQLKAAYATNGGANTVALTQNGCTSGAQPDLAPTTPSGWSGSIVASPTTGTTTDGMLNGGAPAYIDLAVRNGGSAAAGPFRVTLAEGGTVLGTFEATGLGSGESWTKSDHPITLAAGSHTLTLTADSAAAVSESNETNNQTSRTFTWQGTTAKPDLTPTTPSGWSGPIVISTTTGTNTDGSPVGNQVAYVDVAVKNTGSAAAGAFTVTLQVDGATKTSWQVSSLAAGAEWKQQDYAMTLAAGSHAVALVADSSSQVAESNEGNNQASKSMTWGSGTSGVVIASDGFEGALEKSQGGKWIVTSYSGSNTAYRWARSSCDASAGSSSADPVRGGSLGSSLSCSATAPNLVGATLSYGTWLNIAGKVNPRLRLKAKGQSSTASGSQGPLDYLAIWATPDDQNFFVGKVVYGNYSNGWLAIEIDLTNWPGLGDLRNLAQFGVDIDFVTSSGSPIGYGFRVDEFEIVASGGAESGLPPSADSGVSRAESGVKIPRDPGSIRE